MKGLPDWVEPAKATLTDERFSDPDWLFERKLDGERSLAYVGEGGAELYSRTRNRQNDRYPELAEALVEHATGVPLLADGEVVAFDRGRTSFGRLQGRIQIADPDRARRSGIAVHLYLFDLLFVDGTDVRARPLRERKRLLRDAIEFADPLRFTVHRNERGEKFFEEACRKGWEGLIAKRADAPYPRGRSRAWLKFKCAAGQELVVVGFTDPQGSRTDFGALLVGYYDGGELRFAGKVGTGFDQRLLGELGGRLRALERSTSPLADPPRRRKGVHWVEPELVAEIGFTEWTTEGRLRHPRFLGLRTDKRAADVVRERP
jgi:bifunctional non-homologous end joining protein LigD